MLRRLRFTLYELFILTLASAVAVSRVWVKDASWADHVFAVVSILFAVGLMNEAWDLWNGHRRHEWASREARQGWQIAVFWRLGLMIVLLTAVVVPYLEAYGVIRLPESEDSWDPVGQETRRAIIYLSMLLGLAGVCPRRSQVDDPRRRPMFLIDGAGWLALFFLCILFAVSHSMITALVHLALQGIHDARPYILAGRWRNPDAILDLRLPMTIFFRWAISSVALLPVNFWLIYQLARQWQRGVFRRLFLGAALSVGLAVPASFAVWVMRTGLTSVSPMLGPCLLMEPLHRWFSAGIVILLLSAGAGIRLLMNVDPVQPISEQNWQVHRNRYYHRSALCMVPIIVVCAIQMVRVLLEASSLPSSWFPLSQTVLRLAGIFEDAAYNPWFSLHAALLIVAIRAIRANKRGSDRRFVSGPFALPLPILVALVPALFIALSSAIPTLYWFGFILWLKSGTF